VLFNVVKFAFLAGLIFLAAWVAGTGRVAYTLIMLVVAGALAYAVVDLLDYEMVKRQKRVLTTGLDRERSRGSA
jgi:hypothetical protein